MTLKMTGTAASNGIGIAPAYIVDKPDLSFEKRRISDPFAEIQRFKNALLAISNDLRAIKKQLQKSYQKMSSRFLMFILKS